jgi:hypothetical protein
MHVKKDKGYDVKECCFVDKTIGEEYFMCFLFGHHPIPDMIIPTKIFKRSPPNIIY